MYYVQIKYLSCSELQQDDEVCDADADDAGEGAPADVKVPVASQGANTLHLLEQELETLQPGPILLLHQALLQGGRPAASGYCETSQLSL